MLILNLEQVLSAHLFLPATYLRYSLDLVNFAF